MRMVVVVVLEPPLKLRQDRLCVRAIMNMVPLERFDERLGHAVGLWRSYRREARHNTDRLGEGDGLAGAVTAAVIREPLHRVRGLFIFNTPLDALEHRLAIAGIDCKGDTNVLSVPAIAGCRRSSVSVLSDARRSASSVFWYRPRGRLPSRRREWG